MTTPKTEPPKRTKPSEVALAEHTAWCQALVGAQEMTDSCVRVRSNLLTLGFPSEHALCIDLDKDAMRWAGIANQLRRDMIAHAELNQIQI